MPAGVSEEDYLEVPENGQYGQGEDRSVAMSQVSYNSTYTPAPPIGILPARAKMMYVH